MSTTMDILQENDKNYLQEIIVEIFKKRGNKFISYGYFMNVIDDIIPDITTKNANKLFKRIMDSEEFSKYITKNDYTSWLCSATEYMDIAACFAITAISILY